MYIAAFAASHTAACYWLNVVVAVIVADVIPQRLL
jgi:hypothetical protein